MPRTTQSFLRRRNRFAFALIIIAVASCLVWPNQHMNWLLPSALATTTSPGESNGSPSAVLSQGVISFAAQNINVNEGAGSANITLTRTGGSDGVLSAKVTLSNVTTSAADYFLSPGSLDTSFTAPPQIQYTYNDSSIVLQPDGKIVAGDVSGVWRLNADGSADTTFNASSATNGSVEAVAIQPDGKILIGGYFTTFNNIRVNNIARLNTDGSLDTTFNTGTGADESVRKILVQADGKIIAQGLFRNFNGISCPGLVRLNSNGSVDFSYNFFGNSYQGGLALQPDGKLLVSGLPGVERLNSDGSPDSSFHFNANYYLYTFKGHDMVLQPDGKILVCGAGKIDGKTIYSIARLNPDGTLDTTFNEGTGADRGVFTLALQPDGKVFVVGAINSFNGTAVKNLARLNANGSVDTTFTNNLWDVPGQSVSAIVLQPDGKIIIRGDFRVLGTGVVRDDFARLQNDLFVTWPAGNTTNKNVSLPIVDDLLDEPNETLKLTLTPLTSGASIGTYANATLTITDNDVPPAITSALPPSVANINTDYNHTFTATGSPAPTFSVTAGNLPPGIYLSPSGVLSGSPFSAGTYNNITVTASNGIAPVATQTFSIKINGGPLSYTDYYSTSQNTVLTVPAPGVLANDSDFERDPLTVVLVNNPTRGTISLNSNGSFVYTPNANVFGTDTFTYRASDGKINGDLTTVFIMVNSGGTLQFVSSVFSWPEDDGSVPIMVRRVGGSSGEIKVNYSTSNGTATAGTDYTATSGTLVFANGVTSQFINVPLTADTVNEPDETINLTLANAQGTGTLSSQSKAVITILNDDTPRLRLSQTSYSVVEGGGQLNVSVARSGDASIPVKINFSTSDTSGPSSCDAINAIASSRCDYLALAGTLEFAAGETSKTISIPIVDDARVEGNEVFYITLSDPTGASLGLPKAAMLTITDNDVTPSTANPVDENNFFVRQHYLDFLDREPEADGFKYWTDILNGCGTDFDCLNRVRVEISSRFFIELEFQRTGYYVMRMYQASYGLPPSYAEFIADRRLVQNSAESQKLFATSWVQRSRFLTNYPASLTPEQFITQLYNAARITDPVAQTAAEQALINKTKTRADVVWELAERADFQAREYNPAFVRMMYFGYLRREVEQGGYDYWMNVLTNLSPNNYRSMICGFVNAGEYQLRFNSTRGKFTELNCNW